MQVTLQKFLLLWGLPICLILAVAGSAHLHAASNSYSLEDPQPLVAESIRGLLLRLRDNAEQIRQDPEVAYSISNELVNPHIDFPRIARLIIGKYWKAANEIQRAQLIREVQDLLIRSYVAAMTGYIDDLATNENIVSFLPSRYQPGDRKASVRANIAIVGQQTARVDYQLYFRGEWKIYDIRIEGISLAITYRSSFGEQIKRNGLNQLIADLVERNRRGEVELPDALTQR